MCNYRASGVAARRAASIESEHPPGPTIGRGGEQGPRQRRRSITRRERLVTKAARAQFVCGHMAASDDGARMKGVIDMRQRDMATRSERWEREDASPRLKQLVPELESLRLSLVENRSGYPISGTRRVQHVMVGTASTRFEIPCGESSCEGGGHDLTPTVGPRLRHRRLEFSGSSECNGSVGGHACLRSLHYAFEATYSAIASAAK